MDGILGKYQFRSSIQVYHGQIMSTDALDRFKNSIKQYIFINISLSTSLDRRRIIPSLNKFSTIDDAVRILFEIDVDSEIDNSKSFSNITPLTHFSQEQQILLMLGSVFQLTNFYRDKNHGLWIVKFTLINVKRECGERDLILCH